MVTNKARLNRDNEVRRVWRYQRGNQNPYIEEEQTTQWPKEIVQKEKQWSTKHTHIIKDRVTRTTLKPGVNNEANINDKIPVCIDRSSSDPLTTDESSGVFVGVVWRKRTCSCYIGNIDQKSTKSGIVHYIVSIGHKENLIIYFIFYFHITGILYYSCITFSLDKMFG